MDRVLIQVPQWAGPIPMGRKGRLRPRAMSEGWYHDTHYFLGPGIPLLNCQVEVEYLFLELFYSSVSLHRVILHYYRYLTRTAEITILELTAN